MEKDKKDVFLVSTSAHGMDTLQGIFEDGAVAKTFATHFKDAIVEKEICYIKLPKLYKFECHLDLATGKTLEVLDCTPSFDPILLQLNRNTIVAVGETAQEAEDNAKMFQKQLNNI